MSGYISGEAGGRRSAQHDHLAGGVRARGDVVICGACTCMPLTTTTSAHAKSAAARLADVLVDEAHRPAFRHIGRDQQQALRRHEGAHAPHQPVGMIEGAESGGVMRKNAQHPTFGFTGIGQRTRPPICFPMVAFPGRTQEAPTLQRLGRFRAATPFS